MPQVCGVTLKFLNSSYVNSAPVSRVLSDKGCLPALRELIQIYAKEKRNCLQRPAARLNNRPVSILSTNLSSQFFVRILFRKIHFYLQILHFVSLWLAGSTFKADCLTLKLELSLETNFRFTLTSSVLRTINFDERCQINSMRDQLGERWTLYDFNLKFSSKWLDRK